MRSTYLVAALLGGTALAAPAVAQQQQQQQQQEGQADATASADCENLVQLLESDGGIAEDLRAELDNIVAEADEARCAVIVTAYEEEGQITQESVQQSAEVVATERAQETVTVQQEIDVEGAAAVYQPPPEISVEQPGAEVELQEGQTEVTVNQAAPRVEIRQGQPRITVQMAQPTIRIEMPEPEIVMTYPDPEVSVAESEPQIAVRMGEPQVSVEMPEPVVELQLEAGQDAQERQLVQNEQGRYVPREAAPEDLEPRISVNTAEPVLRRTGENQAPVVNLSRAEPEVIYQAGEPEVSVEFVGEPQIEVAQAESARVTIEGGTAGEGQQGQQAQAEPQAGGEDAQALAGQAQQDQDPQQQDQMQQAQQDQQQDPMLQDQAQQEQMQQEQTATAGTQPAGGGEQLELTVAQLRNTSVFGAGGDEAGTIDAVVETQNGPAIVIERGGFLGIGGETLVIPVEGITVDAMGRLVVPGATADEINALHDGTADTTRRLPDEEAVVLTARN